jgi:hypothetical protein
VPVRGLRIRRHFHVIHAEGRTLPASARAFLAVLDAHAGRPAGTAIASGPAGAPGA